jgi:hypothetical protein
MNLSPHIPVKHFARRLQPKRQWVAGLATVALVTTSWAGLPLATPAAESLEEIRLTYGSLEVPPVPLADLESFVRTGIPSRDLQLLLNLLRLDEAQARQLLTREIEIDVQSLREVSNSFVGQFLWRLLATTITVDEGADVAWRVLRDAVLQASSRDRFTLLDILRGVDASVLVVDSQQVMALAARIGENFKDIQGLLSILLGP